MKNLYQNFLKKGRQYCTRCWAYNGIAHYLGRPSTQIHELLLKDKQEMEEAYKELEISFINSKRNGIKWEA